MTTTVVEKWRSVVGYEGLYEVSNLGRVRSLPREVRCGLGGSGRRIMGGKVLTPNPTGPRREYRHVHLSRESVLVPISIHRAVAIAFLGLPPTPDHIVLHVRGASAGDAVGNLRWGTHAENTHDARVQGTLSVGAQRHNAKLTELHVRAIRQASGVGEGHSQLARQYGVSPANITNIVKRNIWKHVL